MRDIAAQGAYEEATPTEELLSLERFLHVIWKRLWIIVLTAVLLTGVFVGLALQQTPEYEATAKLLVGQESEIITRPNDAPALRSMTRTMVEAVKSRPIAEAAIKELGWQMTPEELLAKLNAKDVADTQFMEVSYTDPDPQTAQQVANAVGTVFSKKASENTSQEGNVSVSVWDQAPLPEAPASPDPVRRGFLALVLGSILGVGVAFLLEHLDPRWRSPEHVSGVPTYAMIPKFELAKVERKLDG